jgi:hypothetical protein
VQDLDFALFYLRLPDLSPAADYHSEPHSEMEEEANNNLLARGDILMINLHQGRKSGIETDINYNKNQMWKHLSDTEQFKDFFLFTDKHFVINGVESESINFYFLPKNKDLQRNLYIECPKENNVRKYCTLYSDFPNKLYGHFTFSRSHLHEWQNLFNQVHRWVGDHIVSNN